MKNQSTQTINEGINVANGTSRLTSKELQTDLSGDELEKLRQFADKYFDKQLKLDADLR